MRAGGSTVQQALTPEAAGVVKQAVSLARRRGHAQVTPLHVANVMLSSSTGLLRAACLQSHSHPLQCKALELCFNVALNRLPASTASLPMLGPHPPHGHGHGHHHHPPSLSNALVAAFKRAQAQQRRGSIESQQQPLLAVKIEVEQLIISILDDPSVSRVMKEAGFSSTQVKSNVEQAVSSSEICGSSTPSSTNGAKPKESATCLSTPAAAAAAGKSMPPGGQVRQEDVKTVMDFLASRKKRSVVFVGECLATTEGVVKAVMDNAGKPEVAPEVLRNVQFISLPLVTFRCLSREEVEQKVGELRCLVNDRCAAERGVVLYLGDLKWAAEYRAAAAGKLGRISCYSTIEHVIVELGRLVSGGSDEAAAGRFWLIGVATYQTYMTCRAGRPSLESIWGLHPLTIPAGSLSLSLSCDGSGAVAGDGAENKLSCCGDCTAKFEAEARATILNGFGDVDQGSASSNLPPWLRRYKEENRRAGSRINHDQRPLGDLCRKWNVICSSSHRNIHHRHLPAEKFLNFSSVVSPANNNSPPAASSHDQPYSYMLQPRQAWRPVPAVNIWRLDQHSWISPAGAGGGDEYSCPGSAFLDHNTNPNPISTSSSETMEVEYPHRFKELNAENLKTLCLELEKRVPWQKDIMPDIAGAVLRSRSGMTRRRSDKSTAAMKEDTWLFFHGGDNEGKEKIARGLAGIVFGRQASFTSIGLSSFSSTRSDSSDDLRIKRSRAEAGRSYVERFTEAVRGNPYSVILLEDIEQTDYCSRMGIKNAIEKGRICSSDGEEICLGEAIIILSCESFDSRSRACSPPLNQQKAKGTGGDEGTMGCRHEEINSHATYLDLNLSAGEEEDDEDDDTRDWFPNDDDVDLTLIFELVDGKFFFKLRDDF